jgi:hypothetical protein
MNIIISSLDANGIKITGSSASDINLTRLFVAQDLNITPVRLDLISNSFTYPVTITASPSFDKTNFYAYSLSANFSIPQDNYNFKVYYYTKARTELELNTSLMAELFNTLEDEHEVVLINDRNIGNITTKIVAGDRNSQQITF